MGCYPLFACSDWQGLAEDLVEELGMVPVAVEQISRLAARYDSSIVLANAHYALAQPCNELAAEPRPAKRKSRP